jgi:hypothetical protein
MPRQESFQSSAYENYNINKFMYVDNNEPHNLYICNYIRSEVNVTT